MVSVVANYLRICALIALTTFLLISPVLADSSILDEVDLADTSRLFLVPGAQTLENGFVAESTTSTAAQLATLTVITTDDVAKSLSSVAAAYRTINPSFNLAVTTVLAAGLVHTGYFGSKLYDFAVAPTAPTAAETQSMPTVEYLPFLAMGASTAYNLPASFTNGYPLRLTMVAICRIYRGNITVWADPTIMALNTGMNWASISPSQRIEVVTLSVSSGVNSVLTGLCAKVDPPFATAVGVTSLGTKYLAPFQTPNSVSLAICADTLSDHPFSITTTTTPRARSVPLNLITIVSTVAGSTTTFDLKGDTTSVELTVIEMASKSTSFSVGLSNPTNPQAWPMGAFQYIFLDNANARTTCSSKRILLDFLIWMYNNDLPRTLFTQASMVPLPDIIKTKYDILGHLRNDILCDNAALVSANDATLFVSADAASAGLVSIYSSFYTNIDKDFTFSVRTLPESLSLERLLVNEAAFAVVRAGLFNDDDLNMIDLHGLVSIPAFMTGIVPIFNLPKPIQTMYLNVTAQLIHDLPKLYPLVLDINTMTRIFLGNITSWLDDHMVALNPQLIPWFNVTEASTTLTVVVGASSLNDPSAATKVLFTAMQSSDVAQESTYRKIFGSDTEAVSINAQWKNTADDNPFSVVLDPSYLDIPPTNLIVVDYESRLTTKTSVTYGSVSYRNVGIDGVGVSDKTLEFRMIQTNTAGVRETVAATTANMNACTAPHLDANAIQVAGGSLTTGTIGANPLLDISTQRNWINMKTPPPSCYPIIGIISVIMPMQYTTNNSSTTTSSLNSGSNTCLMAEHGIEFANYIQSTSSLSLAAEQLGLVRLASSDIIKQLSQSVFYASTCDGLPVLVTVPSYFFISSAISQFGYAIGALGLITTAISIIIVMLYRHRVIIRSSSVPFLLLILCGVGCLYVSLIAWSHGPESTTASCTSFVWFSQIGFMMVYVPLFAKTYRVWRIFSGSHLKVVKLSNRRLLAMSLAAIALDVIILAIWQGVSPIRPIEYTRQLNDHWDYYTHCSVDSKGLPFVIIEAVYKAGLLLFGALMAFSTRNVKATFNESTQIAWSIYNTLLAAIIVAIMITFLSAIQSTLIILVQIFLLWVAFCTWALLFIPKFQLLVKSENEVIETSMSELLPQEKSNGYSFASVAFMSGGQLKAYYEALKSQVIKVQQRLGVPTTKFDGNSQVETIAAINNTRGHNNSGGVVSPNRSPKHHTTAFTELPTTTKNNSGTGTPGSTNLRLSNYASGKTITRPTSTSGTPRSANGTSTTTTTTAAGPAGRTPSPPTGAATPTNVLISSLKSTTTPPINNQLIHRLGVRASSDEAALLSASRRESLSAQRYQPMAIHVKAATNKPNNLTRLSVEEHNNIHHFVYNTSPSPTAASAAALAAVTVGEGEATTSPNSVTQTPPKTPPTQMTTLPGSTVLTLPHADSLSFDDGTTAVMIEPLNVRESVESMELNPLPRSSSASASASVSLEAN